MADEGTFIGEVQRGWARFWCLSWWWKGPILGGGFVALIIIASVATGGSTSDDTPKYPAGSLTVTEPVDGATVDTKEIVIRGTAPPGAEVRRDSRGGKKDDKFIADADGKWEYKTKLGEGENTFNFFLQDAKDVKAKLTVKYAPPVVAEPTATVTASPEQTPAPTVEPTPAPTETPVTTYPMVDVNSFSEGTAERAFAEWLTAWKDRDFNRMAAFSQKTWLDGEDNPAETLEAQYGFKELLGAEFTNIVRTTEVANDIAATIHYSFGSDVQKKQITARVIREAAPYEPSPAGDWGVNPISTLREEDLP